MTFINKSRLEKKGGGGRGGGGVCGLVWLGLGYILLKKIEKELIEVNLL